jgi:cytoskeletal protein CcmA (bactofilin family)
MAKSNEMENHTINLIGTGTIIDGNIVSNGDIRIDGSLKGNLSTKGKVIVGDTGKISGEINCKNFEVEGSVDGKVNVTELLSLRAKSKIIGDITTSKLAIEPGAIFTGKCDMSGGNSNLNASRSPESKL